jgi:hypothetical protein
VCMAMVHHGGAARVMQTMVHRGTCQHGLDE